MDKASTSNQDALWQQQRGGQDANLDCGLHIRADRHCQKTLSPVQQSS